MNLELGRQVAALKFGFTPGQHFAGCNLNTPCSFASRAFMLTCTAKTSLCCCCCCCCCWVTSVVSASVRPHRRQPTRVPHPWDSPGKNTAVGCHFLLQCMKWKVNVKSLSHVRLIATSWTRVYQAPQSMGFSRQEYWSGVPLPSPKHPSRGWQ